MLNNLLQTLHERNIKLQVLEGKLKVFDVDGNLDNTILSELRTYKEDLLAIFSQSKGFTPSDFPFANLTQEQLDAIEKNYTEVENIYPAVPMQQGMLFHGFEDGTGESYTSQTVYKLFGNLDDIQFQKAWQMVAQRHDTFRTCFVGFETHTINQVVLEKANIPFNTLEWKDLDRDEFQRKLNEFKKADKNKGFDFAVAPLMRLTKVMGRDDEFYLVWTRHHSLLDGWCQSIVFKEVMQCYDHLTIGSPLQLTDTPPYQSYIEWFVEQDQTKAKTYWQDYLQGFSYPTPLVVDKQIELAENEDSVGRYYFNVDRDTTKKLASLANQYGVTINTVFQAAWSLLLASYSGEKDIVFGATVSGRPAEVKGVESIVGLFINSLPVRVNFNNLTSVLDVLENLSASYSNSNAYSYCPLNEIQKNSEVSNGASLFDSLVIFSNFAELDQKGVDVQAANSLTLDSVQTDEYTNYGLTFMVTMSDTLSVRITYPRNRFSEDVLAPLGDHICNLLISMSNGFEQKLSELQLLSSQELGLIAEDLQSVHSISKSKTRFNELFERQVEKSPHALAIRFLDRTLSYEELNGKANQFAHLLREKGVKPGDNVALCLERCEDIPISILAIMKIGAAYVPVDRFYPSQRFQNIFVEANVKHLIVHNNLCMLPGLEGPEAIAIDHPDTLDRLVSLPNTNINATAEFGETAYVIFTSGSRGKPKGVEVTHSNICHFRDVFASQMADLDLPSHSSWLWHVSYTFDASLKGMAALSLGGAVTIAAESQYQDTASLLRLMREGDIQVFNGIPQLVELMIEEFEEQDRYHLILSGDTISKKIHSNTLEYISRVDKKAINAYGPTELSVNISYGLIEENVANNVIGKVVEGNYPIVISPFGAILPKGIPGQLCVSGASVSIGYINNPEYNELAYAEYNLLHEPSRFYRTGDRVVLNHDDTMQFIGRTDDQVKIRGFRIELDEVREALTQVPSIRESYLSVFSDSAGINHHVAYCQLNADEQGEESEQTEEIRRSLSKLIPEYMLPSYIILLSELPKTPGGKVNKASLPNPLDAKKSDLETDPQSEVEKTLLKIWCEVLGHESIGLTDNFFSIGGDSIMSMQIMAMAKRSGIVFSVRQLLIGQSIRGLAKMIETDHQETSKQSESEGFQKLLPIQHRFFDIDSDHVNHYNQSSLLKVSGNFNFSHLEKAVQAIVERHDVLRLKFFKDDNKWYSKYNPSNNFKLKQQCIEEDISHISDTELAEFMWSRGSEVQKSLDIEAGILFKVYYFNRGQENSGRVLFCFHHLVTDAVSRWVMMLDISQALKSLEKGEEIVLKSKAASYQQWAEYLTTAMDEGKFAEDREYWLNNYIPVEDKLPDESAFITEPDLNNFEFVELQLSKELFPAIASMDKSAIEDMLLSSLMHGLAKWSGQDTQHIDLESHGRINLDGAPDVSETAGWFTSVYPLSVKVAQQSPEQVFNIVRAQRSNIPNSGIGFGLFKYFANDFQMRDQLKGRSSNVVFNFLSESLSSSSSEQEIEVAPEAVGPQYDLNRVTPYQFNILSFIADGVLHIQFNYSNVEYSLEKAQTLSENVSQALQSLLRNDQLNTNHGLNAQIAAGQDNILIELNQSNADTNLFCIHPIGGYANHYESMAASLADTCKVFGLQAPDIFVDYHTEKIESLVEQYIQLIKRVQPKGPYHLLGWSAGARLAYEMATQLDKLGDEIGLVGLLDQPPTESQTSEDKNEFAKVQSFFGNTLEIDWNEVTQLSTEQAIKQLALAAKTQGLAHKGLSIEQVENYIRFLVTFPHAMDKLKMKQSSLNLHLYKVLDQEEADRYELNQYYNWDQITSGDISVMRVAGNHSNMIERPYVDSLIEPLKSDLTKVKG
ncbi:condensation domain-containing protein [Pseudoalteromonas maricaloris]|uniref:AMP-binding protein n=1 Tax=Pseudoalteromonas maricaloris TaxID=184924 RepID=A0A8I2H675_9GAMM|nr:condensation domain-containing protein [Pseudoalteromonas maricaloris]NLR24343.1 AMP-binding protein [Pseudoalteromonas maricaloris]WOX30915.1 condensation domain-containing protein [Pseudoalteromonas maricaloris]